MTSTPRLPILRSRPPVALLARPFRGEAESMAPSDVIVLVM
jgi:hypothetical protein